MEVLHALEVRSIIIIIRCSRKELFRSIVHVVDGFGFIYVLVLCFSQMNA